MDLTTIIYEKRGPIAYVTLNRPDKLNAMNEVLHSELADIWMDFRDDDSLKVAILSGKGRCFCAGADLSGGVPENFVYDGSYPDISQTKNVYKPIIAALHSHVVGYGMWIAMDADFRIATEDTSFWLPEPQWGISTIPSAWFPRLMPWAIASELLLLAEHIGAQRAYDVGMLNKIVPQGQLMAEAERMAQRIASLSPQAVQGMKESMVKAAALDYAAVDEITATVQNRVMNAPEIKEGIRAFVEKRQAIWPTD